MSFRKNLRSLVSAALLFIVSWPAAAYTVSYYNTREEAFEACVREGSVPRICPVNWSYCWTHWPHNTGGGLMSWTSVETNKGCGLSAGSTTFSYVFPVGPLPTDTTLIGPTSADVVSDQALALATENIKQLGGEGGAGGTCYGNPVDAAVGNKVQREVDFEGPPGVPSMARTYNSQNLANMGYIGYAWTFDYSVRIIPNADGVTVREPGGRVAQCDVNLDGTFACPADVRFKLERDGLGYKRTWQDGAIERYNAPGNVIERFSPTGMRTRYDMLSNGAVWAEYGPGGHRLVPVWGTVGLSEIWRPDNLKIRYYYDNRRRLMRVLYPDNTARQYLYEDPLNPHALTGIIDETGKRVGNYAYDAATGQAVSTARPDGTESYGLNFSGAGATVTDAAGNAETLAFTRNLGINLLAARTNSTDGKTQSRSFDANNNLVSETDEEGRTTTYTWDAVNRPTQKVEAAGTPEARTTTWAYLDDFLALPTVIEEPSVFGGAAKRTEIAYDERNRPVQVTVSGYTPSGAAVSRTMSLTYAPAGQIGSITDATGRTTRFAYPQCTTGFSCEMLASVTNPAGQVTTFGQYDANGRLLRKTDPNGLVTTYTYDLRGRVRTVTETPALGTARTTTFNYDAAGRLLSAVFPGRGTLTYTYDAADRLASVTDSLGNKVTYAFDARGNPTRDTTFDPNGTLVRQVDMAWNARNQLAEVNAGGSIAQLVHDAVWNLVERTDPNGNVTRHDVDALDRVIRTVDAIGGMTEQEFDGGGNLAGVVTPNSAETRFEIDDLGNVLKEVSPDRGIITQTFDAAGNALTRTDARGITVTFTYDVLNRVTSIAYPNPVENVVLTYDACQVSQLCSVTDQSGTRSWSYDGFGRVASETLVQGGVSKTTSYTWTAGDDLASIIYPSGRVVTYTRNAIGNITAVSTNGSNVLSGRTYRADGLVKAQTWGNGITETKAYDLQGRMTGWTAASLLNRTFAYDGNGNVTQLDAAQFQYDPLDRLTWEPGQILQYDGNGNRLLDSAGPYSYTPASNRMATGPPGGVVLDASGNTLSYAGQTYAYNQAGKLVSASAGGQTATYTYRHDGLRASKTVNGVTTFFHYGLDGRLIAETDGSGNTVREYVWDDSVPVAQIAGGVITYLHVDHLGTPRLGTNSAGAQVWTWDSNAFGTHQPTGSVTVNLRFPGQYFDAETGLHQNWNRTYHPGLGRYLESDPIGLAGGVNTYGYVEGNPLRFVDPYGLWAWGDPLPQGVVDFSAGFGDTLSFGATNWVRNQMGTNGAVDKCSGAYSAGEWAGIGHNIALGGAIGWRLAGVKGSGKEFSHWIPNRMRGPRSKWNGNFVTSARHYYHDPFRYPRGWRDLGPKWPAWMQQFDRIPNVYKGGASGGAAGTASLGINSREGQQ